MGLERICQFTDVPHQITDLLKPQCLSLSGMAAICQGQSITFNAMNPMKTRQFLVLAFIAVNLSVSAQVMNVRKWRASEKDSLDNAMYLIDESLYLKALPIFEELLNNHPKEEFLRYTYAKCALYRSDKHEDAYNYLTELYVKNGKIPDIQYDVAQASLFNYKFDEATTYINQFLGNKRLSPEQKRNGDLMLVYIGNARHYYNHPSQAKLINLGASINTDGSEYVPAVTADESRMIFTYAGKNSMGGLQNENMQPDPHGEYLEDIYQSMKEGKDFLPAKPIDYLNTNIPDAVVSINGDGSRMFVYKNIGDDHGDLYLSQLMGATYSNPVKLQGEVNSYSWDGHCSLSPDGKTLYFSSERGGGYGGRDIYKATLMADSTWGIVMNLGDSINTPYDEDAPFMHADGRTLYFSSKCRASMGGYDVFKSVMEIPDSNFRKKTNLGYPINSPADDIYFVTSADSKHGYYSTARKDGFGLYDIYLIETNFSDATPVYLVKGRTSDKTSPVEATVKVEITSSGNSLFKKIKSNSVSGDYLVTLPVGASYKFIYSYPEKADVTFTVDATALTSYSEQINNVDFTIPPQVEVIAQATATPAPTIAAVSKTITSSAPTKVLPPAVVPVVTATLPATATSPATVAPAATVAPVVAVKSPSPLRDASFPTSPLQEKTLRYVEKYGEQKADELEFRVQLSAVKADHNKVFPNQNKLGKIDKVDLGDGFIRITAGGPFKTIAEAFAHNRKVVKAGQKEGFVIAIYKGKKVSYDYLEQEGVFKAR